MPIRHRAILATLALLGAVSGRAAHAQDSLAYRNAALPVDVRVRDLLGRMTLEEKFWQLFMIPGDLDDPAHDYSHGIFGLQVSPKRAALPPRPPAAAALERTAHPAAGRARIDAPDAIQVAAAARARTPSASTPSSTISWTTRDSASRSFRSTRPYTVSCAMARPIFPPAIALAATLDTGLVRQVGEAIAIESAEPWHPRNCSRRWPTLPTTCAGGASRRPTARIRISRRQMAGAFVWCARARGRRDRHAQTLRRQRRRGRTRQLSHPRRRAALDETYFPPFHAAIARGARSIMTAYNSVDGVAGHAESRLLTDVLQRAVGLHRVRDLRRRRHRRADRAAASRSRTRRSPRATHSRPGSTSCSSRPRPQYRPYWRASRDWLIPTAVIDAAVARVLRAKFALGLFEHPYLDAGPPLPQCATPRTAIWREAAARGHRAAPQRTRHASVAQGPAARRRDRRRRHRGAHGRLQRHRRGTDRRCWTASAPRCRGAPRRVCAGPGTSCARGGPGAGDALAHRPMATRRAPVSTREYFDNITLEGPPRLGRAPTRA